MPGLAGFTAPEGKVHRFLQEARGNAGFSEGGRPFAQGLSEQSGLQPAPRIRSWGLPFRPHCVALRSPRRQASHWVPDSTGTCVHVGRTNPDGTHSEPLCPLCPGCSSPSDQGLRVRVPALERKGDSRPVPPPPPQQVSLPQVPLGAQGCWRGSQSAWLWY